MLSTSDSPIAVGEGKIEIRDGGVVSVDGNEVGSLKVVILPDPAKIEKEGQTRFAWRGASNAVQRCPIRRSKEAFWSAPM